MKVVLPVLLLGLLQSLIFAQPPDFSHFENKIRPELHKHCVKCHGERKDRGGLRLDSPAAIRKGGDSGAIFVPGKPKESLLIHAIGYADPDLQMPPKKQLATKVIADFTQWVKDGAPMPGDSANAAASPPAFDLEERKKHWAWQPISKAPAPSGVLVARHPIDAFIQKSLRSQGLEPGRRAERRVLVRRIYFDLIGLPPTRDEVSRFLSDTKPGAWERLVGQLLDSSHFGEKWGRHLLDLVGYTETQGFEYDFHLPNAWQYRDYVIRALNDDVPYDRFLTEHIAGDLVEKPRRNPEQRWDESPLGTAFWLFGQEPHSPVSTRVDQLDRTARKLDVFSKAFLGMTVACARCHDHKFDAISTEDYYALAGFVHSSRYRQLRFETEEKNLEVAAEISALRRTQGRRILETIGGEILVQLKGLARDLDRATSPPVSRESTRAAAWRKYLAGVQKDATNPFVGLNVSKGPLKNRLPWWFEYQEPVIPKGATVIENYTSAGAPSQWKSDGPSFGLAPSRIGDVHFSTDANRPIHSVATRASASRDQQWNGLKPAKGVQNSPTQLKWPQAGRTLHTRSVKLTTGKLHYLVAGEGIAFAEINSHRVIHGPLHGRSIKRFKTKGGNLQWVTHNLETYAGRRVHVEFSSVDDKPLDILMVVESGEAPGLKSVPGPLLIALQKRKLTQRQMVKVYAEALMRSADQMSKGSLSQDAQGQEAAGFATWMLAHPELIGAELSPRTKSIVARFSNVIARNQKLISQIRPVSQQACVLMDGSGMDERVLLRGSHLTPGKPAPRRFLSAIDGRTPLPLKSGSGRLELAQRMTDPNNPLVSRVMVNRLWHHVFGRGIVSTTDDFGVKGERPSHPELLDWLAQEFVNKGWSIKATLKLLVTSHAYQQHSQRGSPRAEQVDPQNKLLHRMNSRRLTAEAIRDAILTTSGKLDRRLHGAPVPVHLTPFMQGRGRPRSGPLDGHGRRSIYVSVRLNFLSPFFLAFDFPRPTTCIGRRTNSNVPAQSLALMNDPFVMGQATFWANRVLALKDLDDEARIGRLYLEAYARSPRAEELTKAKSFLNDAEKHHGGNRVAAWADLCHVLLNTKEFWHLL